MTPRRLDPDAVTAKLELMAEALDVLEGVGHPDAAALRHDPLLRGGVERFLMLLVDQAVAINLHLAGALGGEVPRDYTASFAALAAVGVIDDALAARLAGSAGMRNVLVHEYVRVDLDIVAAAIPAATAGYRAYVRAVATYVGGVA